MPVEKPRGAVMGHQNRRLRRREAGQLLSRQQRVAGFRIRLPGATEEEREANVWHGVVLTDLRHGGLGRGDAHVQGDAWQTTVHQAVRRLREVLHHRVRPRLRSNVQAGVGYI